MKINTVHYDFLIQFFIAFLVFFCIPSIARTDFYVDPQWTKKENGSSQHPWKSLSDKSWEIINAALLRSDVTVFFSSHPESIDSDNCYDPNNDLQQEGIELTKKMTDSKFYLTFDGGSLYNSNIQGKWEINRGKSMCRIKHFNSQNDIRKKTNRIKINKFRIEKNDNGKALSICGDYWTISNCDIYHSPLVKDGPLILIVPVADKEHGGSNYNAPQCTDITLTNNKIHNSCGELIYLGGGGCTKVDSTGNNYCQGFPSHKNITISNNYLYEGGIYGQEGDGIDCKGGLSNVLISNNEIFNMHSPAYRAITTKGINNAIIEKNYIHNCTGLDDAAIAIVNNWGTPDKVDIRNNIITFNDRSGIRIYGGKNINIINNTIYNNKGHGIELLGGSGSVVNNLLIDNLKPDQIFSRNNSIICSNNGFSGKNRNFCNNSVFNLTDKIFRNVNMTDFSLSDGVNRLQIGIPWKNFSDDFKGKVRNRKFWTIGALEKQNE